MSVNNSALSWHGHLARDRGFRGEDGDVGRGTIGHSNRRILQSTAPRPSPRGFSRCGAPFEPASSSIGLEVAGYKEGIHSINTAVRVFFLILLNNLSSAAYVHYSSDLSPEGFSVNARHDAQRAGIRFYI